MSNRISVPSVSRGPFMSRNGRQPFTRAVGGSKK